MLLSYLLYSEYRERGLALPFWRISTAGYMGRAAAIASSQLEKKSPAVIGFNVPRFLPVNFT